MKHNVLDLNPLLHFSFSCFISTVAVYNTSPLYLNLLLQLKDDGERLYVKSFEQTHIQNDIEEPNVNAVCRDTQRVPAHTFHLLEEEKNT